MNSVGVLGCGPAGLLAAHAAARRGARVTVYSRAVPSSIGGAQYLHAHIPEVTSEDPDGVVEFIFLGTEEGYAEKVYGDPLAATSWGEFSAGQHQVWNMRMAYSWLWTRYESRIVDLEVDAELAVRLLNRHDLVLSTIPATALCTNPEHAFLRQAVAIDYFELEARERPPRDYILYSGEPFIPYYRKSVLFGWKGLEYPPENAGAKVKRLVKPLSTDCDCLPEIHRLGRYGQFKKGVLIHDAYFGAEKLLA